MLELKEIHKAYKKTKVINGINLKFNKGEIVGLLGPNGAGKTTTFYILSGFLMPDKGNIYLDQEDVTKLPIHLRAKRGILYLPQETSIFRRMTVEENIRSAIEIYVKDEKEIEQRVEEVLVEFNLNDLRGRMGYALSGGERRRAEIARAFSVRPNYLILDEPFSGIDPVTVDEIQKLLTELKNKGLGILLSDHNVEEALKICDRSYIIHRGDILVEGSSEEIIKNEQVKRYYLGKDFNISR